MEINRQTYNKCWQSRQACMIVVLLTYLLYYIYQNIKQDYKMKVKEINCRLSLRCQMELNFIWLCPV